MRTVRVTVDIPEEEHFYFKMACAKLNKTLKTFLLEAGEKRLEEIENEWLTKEVEEVKKRMAKGEETFEPLENVLQEMGIENVIPRRTKQHRKKISGLVQMKVTLLTSKVVFDQNRARARARARARFSIGAFGHFC